MPNWANSDRRSRLPADWPAIRRRVLKRDGYRCTHTDEGVRCSQPATDVDHIVRGDNHTESNLRSLCSGHHRTKSSSEGGAASAASRREIRSRFRRVEPHPGELDPSPSS